jgi:hypothetical protein
MPVIIAKWPNGSFSVLQVPAKFSITDLFWQLDQEDNPQHAELLLLKPKDGWSHATFDWKEGSVSLKETGEVDFIKLAPNSLRVGKEEGILQIIKWPKGIVRQAYRALGYPRDASDSEPRTLQASELADLPAEPTETFSVEEIRSMQPFCGVYFAWNDDGSCHYVGESRNVTSRVSASREEIGGRRIGAIKCAPHDRKRIEAYYIAILDPPGNAISTHRMMAKESSP